MWKWMRSDRLRVERVRGPVCGAALTSKGLYWTGPRRDLSPHFGRRKGSFTNKMLVSIFKLRCFHIPVILNVLHFMSVSIYSLNKDIN